MLELVIENSFDKDYKREKKSGLETKLLLNVINQLQSQIPLDKTPACEYKALKSIGLSEFLLASLTLCNLCYNPPILLVIF